MALLDRQQWYDLARSTEWSPSYVTNDDLFPVGLSGGEGIPEEKWSGYDEPYKVSYREYVSTQRQKDEGAYSVRLPSSGWTSTTTPTPAGSAF